MREAQRFFYNKGMLHDVFIIYLFALFIGLPLYFTDGYRQIGDDKFYFFQASVRALVVVLLLFAAARLFLSARELFQRRAGFRQSADTVPVKRIAVVFAAADRLRTAIKNRISGKTGCKKEETHRADAGTPINTDTSPAIRIAAALDAADHLIRRVRRRFRISDTDLYVVGFFLWNALSYLMSPYRRTLWIGSNGWFMGMFMQGSVFLLYLLSSRLLRRSDRRFLRIFLWFSAVSQFFVSFLNRFSLRLLSMNGEAAEFVATLGNVNWFCSFWALLFPAGAYLFFISRKRRDTYAWFGFCVLSLLGGLCLTSQGVLLVLVFFYLWLFFLSFRGNVFMERFLLLAEAFWGCCAFIDLLRYLRWKLPWFPLRYDMEGDMLFDYLTNRRLGIRCFLLFGALLAAYHYFFIVKRRFSVARIRRLGNFVLAGFFAALGLYVLVVLIRGSYPQFLSFLNGKPYSALDDGWGSGRGTIWRGTARMFSELSFVRRFTGVGPDGYSFYLYTDFSDPESIVARFHGARLTNAHCVALTMLVNQGIGGVLLYAGIFASSLRRQYRKMRRYPKAGVFFLSMIAYLAGGLVSFDQTLNYPYVFLALGAAEAMLKRYEGRKGRRKYALSRESGI